MGGRAQEYGRGALHVEGQNDERLEGLLGKVKMLKDVSCLVGSFPDRQVRRIPSCPGYLLHLLHHR